MFKDYSAGTLRRLWEGSGSYASLALFDIMHLHTFILRGSPWLLPGAAIGALTLESGLFGNRRKELI